MVKELQVGKSLSNSDEILDAVLSLCLICRTAVISGTDVVPLRTRFVLVCIGSLM